ncbi:hypothetical protein CH333_06865 [candidate division WOR-3 bacterium JGI_Cruoil_03_44_89]|uniref:Glycosyltransferase RgtA/B/C/D-like domain-containing protein n=1 Tax=candidate division WOR-3 bacterium JGI_Cruoil_03_44_89 TaxID=1973748 RepID=A0A235BRY0_UNCW3|nr:MAG: hypothetical protein CH333_06865 [candidate division WOR-3 bacterium JGI_Cruoil_03_44_89]
MSGTRSASLWLFIAFVAFYTITMSGHIYSYDDEVKLKVTESIIERGAVSIGTSGKDKAVYSYFPIGSSIAYIPFYLLGRCLSSLVPSLPSGQMIEFCVSWYNIPITALIMVCIFLLLSDIGFGKRSSVLTCVILGLGTTLWPYSKQAWSEPTVGLLLLTGLLALNRYLRGPDAGKAFLVGILIGLSGCFRLETVICVLPFIVAIGVTPKGIDNHRRLIYLLFFVLGVSLFWSLNLVYNNARYGNIFAFGYSSTISKLTSVGTYSLTRLLERMGQLSFSLSKGVFIFSLPIVLFFFSIKQFYIREKTLTLVAISIIVLVFGFLCLVGGSRWAWGPRYLVYIVPLLILPVATLIKNSSRRVRRSVWIVFTFGFLINLLGVSTSHTVVMEKILHEWGEDALRESYSAAFPPPEHSTLFRAGKEFSYYMRSNNLTRSPGLTDTEIRYGTFDFWFTLGYFRGIPLLIIIPGVFFWVAILCFAIWRLQRALNSSSV